MFYSLYTFIKYLINVASWYIYSNDSNVVVTMKSSNLKLIRNLLAFRERRFFRVDDQFVQADWGQPY